MFLHRGVKTTRVFTNRLLEALRNITSHTVQVTEAIRRDLKWFTSFAHIYNGYSSYRHPTFLDDTPIELNASLKGLGDLCIKLTYLCIYSNLIQGCEGAVNDIQIWATHVAGVGNSWGPYRYAAKVYVNLGGSQ